MPLDAVPVPAWVEPARVFAAFARNGAPVFWLDAGPDAADGWSWIGTGTPESDPERIRAVAIDQQQPSRRGGPFRGGWVGWLGYEDAAARAGAPAFSGDAETAATWVRVTRFVAFDHGTRQVWTFGGPLPETVPDCGDAEASVLQAAARHTPEEYEALIGRCRSAIREGDAYQLCLTTRFSVDGEVDPVAAYSRLRRDTPAHHGGVIVAGEIALASASPERFLEVSGGMVRTRPIKGTRPRGADPDADARMADELRRSEKERAENVMIVDLMRNDLARVCIPASVTVESLLDIESYPAVHQLVSTVAGRARPATTVGDLLDATFPAGSMTGAPKLSAMTILHGLEGAPRGVFAGAFGWVGDDGALDLAMVIRSIVTHPEGAYVGAGGGITWRSDAAAEVAEVAVKATGPLRALGAELPEGWRSRLFG